MLVQCLCLISVALAIVGGSRLDINFDLEKIESYRPITPELWCMNGSIAEEYRVKADKEGQRCCMNFGTCTSGLPRNVADIYTTGYVCICEIAFNSCVAAIDGGKFVKGQNVDRIAMGYYLSYVRPMCV